MPSLDTCAALAMPLGGWVDEIDVFSVGKQNVENHGQSWDNDG